MKIFVPISDALLGNEARLSETVVPFSPDFLHVAGRAKEGRKPANWISDCDYASACKRLRESQQEHTSGGPQAG